MAAEQTPGSAATRVAPLAGDSGQGRPSLARGSGQETVPPRDPPHRDLGAGRRRRVPDEKEMVMTVHLPPDRAFVIERSRSLILQAQTDSGAYPAAETFPAYRGFCWLRDGSFVADAMSVIGEAASAEAFFDWCARVIRGQRPQIERIVAAAQAGRPLPDSQMLATRFRFDTSAVDDGWENFQLDGYGTWIWAMVGHARRHGVDPGRWGEAVEASVDYLVSSWERPCFDWWEEHSEAVHTATLGSILAGLRAATGAGLLGADRRAAAERAAGSIEDLIWSRAVAEGPQGPHLVKWIGNEAVDGALSALVSPLAVVDPASGLGRGTIAAVEAQLVVDGGVYRFRDDVFFGGGRWPLLTCFLGLARLAGGDRSGAEACLDWAVSQAGPDGDLPEQVDGGRLLAPDRRQEWLDRWGDAACPLLWSHGMVLRLAADLGLAPAADGRGLLGEGGRR